MDRRNPLILLWIFGNCRVCGGVLSPEIPAFFGLLLHILLYFCEGRPKKWLRQGAEVVQPVWMGVEVVEIVDQQLQMMVSEQKTVQGLSYDEFLSILSAKEMGKRRKIIGDSELTSNIH